MLNPRGAARNPLFWRRDFRRRRRRLDANRGGRFLSLG